MLNTQMLKKYDSKIIDFFFNVSVNARQANSTPLYLCTLRLQCSSSLYAF